MNLTISLDEQQAAHLQQQASSRQLSPEQLAPEKVFAPTCLENLYVLEQFGNLRGKRVLDIGCGQGDTSAFFALCEAEVASLRITIP